MDIAPPKRVQEAMPKNYKICVGLRAHNPKHQLHYDPSRGVEETLLVTRATRQPKVNFEITNDPEQESTAVSEGLYGTERATTLHGWVSSNVTFEGEFSLMPKTALYSTDIGAINIMILNTTPKRGRYESKHSGHQVMTRRTIQQEMASNYPRIRSRSVNLPYGSQGA